MSAIDALDQVDIEVFLSQLSQLSIVLQELLSVDVWSGIGVIILRLYKSGVEGVSGFGMLISIDPLDPRILEGYRHG